MDVEHETAHYCGQSVAFTDGQGIPDHVNMPSEQYDGIACMIRAVLAEGQHTDPDKSVLTFVVIFYILFDVKYSILRRVCRDAGCMRVYTGG